MSIIVLLCILLLNFMYETILIWDCGQKKYQNPNPTICDHLTTES